MHFYSLGYFELMSMPIKMFWYMNSNIDRISAQRDMRSLAVAVNCQSGEGATDQHERLTLEIGNVIKLTDNPMSPINAYRDESGFEELRAMAAER